MDTLIFVDQHRRVLLTILQEYCNILNRNSETSIQLIISQDQTRYLIIDEGWQGIQRIHNLIFDAEIRDQKIWLHHDGLDHGITDELVAEGVPKDCIVLAFHPPHIRKHTGYGTGVNS
ncbi:XisI protein [Spirulina major CS-329]|uniref:XisI protein n=1 Tax=Spirulina TaxID=1154 RepID=UPI00232B374C|nr:MULTISPECIES: XisI protein [Spirulina]MDB9495817.1 XisI protein [Spirulina subsalsa CS-330]MDB9505460.1 XisI protein [Spirulina major CS-329]